MAWKGNGHWLETQPWCHLILLEKFICDENWLLGRFLWTWTIQYLSRMIKEWSLPLVPPPWLLTRVNVTKCMMVAWQKWTGWLLLLCQTEWNTVTPICSHCPPILSKNTILLELIESPVDMSHWLNWTVAIMMAVPYRHQCFQQVFNLSFVF